MTSRRLVLSELIRIYRSVALWFWIVVITVLAIVMTAVNQAVDPSFSLWLLIVGSAAKYWLGVVGVLLVSLHLRQFVAHGITRRDFLAGAAVFGVAVAVLFAVAVPLGHGAEQALIGLAGPLPAGYPTISLGTGVRELGYVLPASLAFLVAGMAGAAGFYRFGAWGGLALVVPALLPIGVAEALLGIDEHGGFDTRFVPYAAAVLITLGITVLIAVLFRRTLRSVAIRRGTT